MKRPAENGQPTPTANVAGSARARSVIAGLIGTGRARRVQKVVDGELILLHRLTAPGQFYWLTRDGREMRVGFNLAEAEPLQPGFLAAMARAVGWRE